MDADVMGYSPSMGDRNTEHGRSPPADMDLAGGPDVDIAHRQERDSDEAFVATVLSTNQLDLVPFSMAAMLDSGFRWS